MNGSMLKQGGCGDLEAARVAGTVSARPTLDSSHLGLEKRINAFAGAEAGDCLEVTVMNKRIERAGEMKKLNSMMEEVWEGIWWPLERNEGERD